MAETLGAIAAFLDAELKGEPSRVVDGAAPLDRAKPSEISFYSNPKYAEQLRRTGAGAVLCAPPDLDKVPSGCAALLSKNPYRDFALLLARSFDRRPRAEPGIHPTAVVHPTAVLASGTRVGAGAVICAGAALGENSVVHALAYIGPGCVLGRDCVIHPHAVLYDGCRLGDRVRIHAGAVLGADGFGFAPDPPKGYVKVPQIGWVEIGDDVEIQANSCVDRGALGPTLVRRGAKIDNLVQVAHNVEVGEHSVLASQAGISGSTKIGAWVTFAGQSAAGGHLHVGDRAVITGQAGIGKDVPPGAMVSGSPAQPTMEHHRGLAELARMPELRKRLKALEQRLLEIEKRLTHS
jgi:UDP-3-O-[3-hydroxymyristoyl] glucosamine N-acyltransferase